MMNIYHHSKTNKTNNIFKIAGLSCIYNNEVLDLSFVHLMKFSAETPRLRKAANRYMPL